MTRNAVGGKIREIRQQLGLSMEEFASRIDEKAKSGTVSNWETGKNLPNKKRLKRIAELGEISLDELLNTNRLDEYTTTELIDEIKRRLLDKE